MHFRVLAKYVSRTEQRSNAMTVVLRHVCFQHPLNFHVLIFCTGRRACHGRVWGAGLLRVRLFARIYFIADLS
jgi:hypothetical protein